MPSHVAVLSCAGKAVRLPGGTWADDSLAIALLRVPPPVRVPRPSTDTSSVSDTIPVDGCFVAAVAKVAQGMCKGSGPGVSGLDLASLIDYERSWALYHRAMSTCG